MSSKTLIAGAGCALVLGCLALLVWPDPAGGMPQAPGTGTAVPAREARSPMPVLERDETAPPPPPVAESRVAGIVIDETGRPVAGVGLRVFLDPFEQGGLEQWRRWQDLESDGQGRFGLPVEPNLEVRVTCDPLGWTLIEPAPRVRAPATDLELVVRARPHARLVVRVRDLSTGDLVTRFGASFHVLEPDTSWPLEDRPLPGFFSKTHTETGAIETIVPLPAATGSSRVGITLDLKPVSRHQLFMAPGEDREVELGWQSGPILVGTVLDSGGDPVAGAFVYCGTQERARGDTPFEPIRRIDGIADAVRTDPIGRFRLPIGGALVTAWHEDHTPVTVPVVDAHRIVLPAAGAIRGRLIDRAGRALAGVEICLDRSRLATTDDTGAFRFDGVEAGIRGLHIPGPNGPRYLERSAASGPWSVRVQQGRTVDVVLDPGFEEVVLQAVSGGRPYRRSLGSWACLIGLGDVASFAIVEGRSSEGRLRFHGVVAGKYVLITQEGHVATCSVKGPAGTVELGVAALVLEAEPGCRLSLVPGGASELVRLMAARTRVKVPESGVWTLAPLPEGVYELVRRDDHELRLVHITAPETRVVFD